MTLGRLLSKSGSVNPADVVCLMLQVMQKCAIPVDIGTGQHMHMGGLAQTPWPIKLVWGEVQSGCGVAMVSTLHDCHMPSACHVCSGHSQG